MKRPLSLGHSRARDTATATVCIYAGHDAARLPPGAQAAACTGDGLLSLTFRIRKEISAATRSQQPKDAVPRR
jgi:hypothetical protein